MSEKSLKNIRRASTVETWLSDERNVKIKESNFPNTRYVTLGIDSHKSEISTTQNRIRDPHCETVTIADAELFG